jgi:oligosaccharide repeat unit polymerase
MAFSIIAFSLVPILFSLRFARRPQPSGFNPDTPLSNTKAIITIWFLLVFVEVLIFGPFPVFQLFGINTLRYTEWGIKGFHGLLNGMLMAYAIINYGLYAKTKNKKNLILFLICLIWPILLMTRQMFMSLIIQCLFVHYYLVGFKSKSVVRISVLLFVVIYVFGLLGDLRSGAESFEALASPTEEWPEYLPSGFLWVYIYVTTPINNVINNIDHYALCQFSPSDAFGGLIPSSIRDAVAQSGDTQFTLVNEYLNVSSAHKNFLAGFGWGGALFYQMLLSLIVSLFYVKYKYSKQIKYCFILAVLGHNIAMSFFVDFFTNLVFLSEIFFIYLFYTKIIIKRDAILSDNPGL